MTTNLIEPGTIEIIGGIVSSTRMTEAVLGRARRTMAHATSVDHSGSGVKLTRGSLQVLVSETRLYRYLVAPYIFHGPSLAATAALRMVN